MRRWLAGASGLRASRLAAGLVSAALASGLACGPPAGTPELANLRCANPEACQSREDPFLLLLTVDFEDDDGDLGIGSYHVFVDGDRVHGPDPLADHFAEAGLSVTATAGSLVLPAPLALSSIHSGMDFVVGIQVEDGAGRTSNRPGIIFRLDFH